MQVVGDDQKICRCFRACFGVKRKYKKCGGEKYLRVLENSIWKGSNDNTKKRTPKIVA